jgi:hypothetical protein
VSLHRTTVRNLTEQLDAFFRGRADLRRPPCLMDVRNRQRRVRRDDGSSYIVSEYRYVPMSDEPATSTLAPSSGPSEVRP